MPIIPHRNDKGEIAYYTIPNVLDDKKKPRRMTRDEARKVLAAIHAADEGEPVKLATLDGVEILRPGRVTASEGREIEITEEDLHAYAKTYDPSYLEATVNIDHVDKGPAFGAIATLRVEGEGDQARLKADIIDMPEALYEAIKDGQFRRWSAEIGNLRDEENNPTPKQYLVGLAILGAKRPAVKGLKRTIAASEDNDVIFLDDFEDNAFLGKWDRTENEARYRVKPAELFRPGTFRTKKLSGDNGKGVSFVIGKLRDPRDGKDEAMVLHAVRFDKSRWPMPKAKAWIKDPDHKVLDGDDWALLIEKGATLTVDDLDGLLISLKDFPPGDAPAGDGNKITKDKEDGMPPNKDTIELSTEDHAKLKAEAEKAEKLAEEKAKLEADAKVNAEKLADFELKARAADIKERLAKLKEAGKITPAMEKAGLEDIALALAGDDKTTVKLAEGKDVTLLDAFEALLASIPDKLVEFAELTAGGVKGDEGALHKTKLYKLVEGEVEIDREALDKLAMERVKKVGDEEKLSYENAVREINLEIEEEVANDGG